MNDISDTSFEETVAKGIVVVDFWAPWCAPCRALAPILDRLAEKHPDVLFVKLNVDENQARTAEYGIRGIPTVQLWKDGKLSQTISGVKSFETYDALLSTQ
jgi:thioredoxin 1